METKEHFWQQFCVFVEGLPQAQSQFYFVLRTWLLCDITGHPIEEWREAGSKAGGKYVSLVNTTYTEKSSSPFCRFVLLLSTRWENQVTGG